MKLIKTCIALIATALLCAPNAYAATADVTAPTEVTHGHSISPITPSDDAAIRAIASEAIAGPSVAAASSIIGGASAGAGAAAVDDGILSAQQKMHPIFALDIGRSSLENWLTCEDLLALRGVCKDMEPLIPIAIVKCADAAQANAAYSNPELLKGAKFLVASENFIRKFLDVKADGTTSVSRLRAFKEVYMLLGDIVSVPINLTEGAPPTIEIIIRNIADWRRCIRGWAYNEGQTYVVRNNLTLTDPDLDDIPATTPFKGYFKGKTRETEIKIVRPADRPTSFAGFFKEINTAGTIENFILNLGDFHDPEFRGDIGILGVALSRGLVRNITVAGSLSVGGGLTGGILGRLMRAGRIEDVDIKPPEGGILITTSRPDGPFGYGGAGIFVGWQEPLLPGEPSNCIRIGAG